MNLTSSVCACFGLLTFVAGPAAAQVTTRISLGTGGIQSNEESYYPSLSADGRYVAFYSDASNLVPGDTNGEGDVFVRDLRTGITTLVSVDSAGAQGDGESSNPAISADGRYVAYFSRATNLVPGDTNGFEDIFVYDRLTATNERVSVDSGGAQADGRSYYPAISADGRFVAFQSFSTNLVAGDTNGKEDVFVHDRITGLTTRVSVDSSGVQGDGDSAGASITADGTRVAFSTSALNLVPHQTTGTFCVHDMASGTTTCVCVDLNGNPANGGGIISGNGRAIVFTSGAANLVPGGGNGYTQMYARDLGTGVTTCLSVDANGIQGNQISSYHSISFDGRFIAFGSQASNLVPNDTNGVKDIFLSDLRLGTLTRVSVNSQSVQANGWCSTPAISANGRFVAFYSDGTNLVHGDTNGKRDVFVRTLW